MRARTLERGKSLTVRRGSVRLEGLDDIREAQLRSGLFELALPQIVHVAGQAHAARDQLRLVAVYEKMVSASGAETGACNSPCGSPTSFRPAFIASIFGCGRKVTTSPPQTSLITCHLHEREKCEWVRL